MRARFGVALLLTCLVAACSSVQVKTDYDRAADFTRYRTYAMGEGKLVRPGLEETTNDLVTARINRAVQYQLQQKGLRPEREDPDLIVRFVAGARTVQELDTVYDGWGMGPFYGDVWLREYDEGTMVIDLIDRSTGQVVWTAIGRAVDQDFRKPEFIDKTVAKAFEKFPPQLRAAYLARPVATPPT
jgi:hypothetical protein